MKKRNKKGSHVGVMLSFVVFITFLAFLYSVLEPAIKSQENQDLLLDLLENNLIKEISSEITLVTLEVLTSPSGDCIKIPHPSGSPGMNLIIKDLDNNAIYFESDSVLRIKWTSPRNGILKINYAEPEFAVISGSVLNCIDFEEGTDYNIKKISEENHVFLKKAGKFFAENDYNGIKTILSFPSTNELGFRLKDSDGNSLAEANMDKDVSTSIYVREVPVQYIDDYGNINAGLLELKIW